MSVTLLWINAGLILIAIALIAVLLLRRSSANPEAAVKTIGDELRLGREESARAGRELREEVAKNLVANSDNLARLLSDIGNLQKNQLSGVNEQLMKLTESNRNSIELLRAAVNTQLQGLQENNEKKLEEMRRMVDEKLQVTLDQRLGASFKLVRDQLEAVDKGLGEMRALATGVGDLKRVLSNVKLRGVWGEIQLGAILEQILSKEQYGCNVLLRDDSQEMVEYAVRLPGADDDPGSCVYLPIDSKFPQEDYLRLVEASEAGDPAAVQDALKALARAVTISAKDIHDKYIVPPRTTDFAVMFLPTEGLYAEIIRQPDLVEELQNKYRVMVAGPTVLAALLNSLRLGFRTLAIQQRAGEVWRILAAVKTEFGKFGDVLEKVRRQLDTASKSIDETGKRTKAMERKLREVEQLPTEEAKAILALAGDETEDNSAE